MMNDIALLATRLTVGTSMFAHGAQKAFGWFDGPGPEGAGGFMESLGLKPGRSFANAAARTEMVAGSMIALGVGGAIGPSMLISTMIVAAATVHAKNGYFMTANGAELNTIYSAAGLAFAGGGYGRISIDALLKLDVVRKPWFTTLALTGGVLGALAVLGQRDSGPGSAPAPQEKSQIGDQGEGDHPDHQAAADATVSPLPGSESAATN
ncbi:MAG: hypothetical protein NVS3B28_08700 [Candidatus Velthaea sp.]